jgi:hypothetical protein
MRFGAIVLLSLGVTLLNLLKPVCVDDAYYLRLARAIAQHPTTPYGPAPHGFETIWGQEVRGAFQILAPPVLPYYLAAGIAIFGDRPTLLKLSLFPFVLLFAWAVGSLARQFAPKTPLRVTAMILLSAATLPCWNLMLDLPALALGLTAVALYGCCGRGTSWRFGLFIGLLLGLAFETKYSAVGCLAFVLIQSWREGRRIQTIAILGGFVFLVAGCELWLASIYGQSHLLTHLLGQFPTREVPIREKRWHLVLPFLTTFGALTPALWLMTIRSAKGYRLGLGLLIVTTIAILIRPAPSADARGVRLEAIFFAILGVFNAIAIFGIAIRNRGLMIWLLIEIGVLFLLSPFCAARRLIGVSIVSTVTVSSGGMVRTGVLSFSILWGLFLATVEIQEAWLEIDAVSEIAAEYPQEKIGFTGHWGFADAAERHGWQLVLPGQSRLEKGDLLIVPDGKLRPAAQKMVLDLESLEELDVRDSHGNRWLRTIPDWYGGKMPFLRENGVRMRVTIFRVRAAFLARPSSETVPISPTRRKE